MRCFFASIYARQVPWEFTDRRTRLGENFHVWLTRYVPPCMLQVYGISCLEKKYSISLFSVLKRVAILMYFSLNWVRRIEGFQQQSPNQSSVKSPSRRSFFLIHNDNSQKIGFASFFSDLKKGIKFRYSSILNWILFFKRLKFLKCIDTLELGSTEDRSKYGMELTNKTSFKISCELSIHTSCTLLL